MKYLRIIATDEDGTVLDMVDITVDRLITSVTIRLHSPGKTDPLADEELIIGEFGSENNE